MKSLNEVGCGCWVVLKKEHWTTSKSFPLILKCAISTMHPILVSGGLVFLAGTGFTSDPVSAPQNYWVTKDGSVVMPRWKRQVTFKIDSFEI